MRNRLKTKENPQQFHDRLQSSQAKEAARFYRKKTTPGAVGRFFSERFSWLGVAVLSCFAVVPLAGKWVGNLLTGEWQSAWRNLKSMIAVPIAGTIGGLIGFFKPSWVGKPIRRIVLPAIDVHKEAAKNNAYYNPMDYQPAMTDPEIKADAGKHIATFENLYPLKSDKEDPVDEYRVFFPGNAVVHNITSGDAVECHIQGPESSRIKSSSECKTGKEMIIWELSQEASYQNGEHRLTCHTRTLHYPGVPMGDVEPESIDDLVNAGIAQVYALKEQNKWSWDDVSEELHLYGHSIGGGIALQVALHFKRKHQVNIKTFVDRSFYELAATAACIANSIAGIPLWLGRQIARLALHGSGGWNLDSLGAFQELDKNYVDFVNLDIRYRPKKTWFQELKSFFGLGNRDLSADVVIQDESTLLHGVASTFKGAYRQIQSKMDENRVYPVDSLVSGRWAPGFKNDFHGVPIGLLRQKNGASVTRKYAGFFNKQVAASPRSASFVIEGSPDGARLSRASFCSSS